VSAANGHDRGPPLSGTGSQTNQSIEAEQAVLGALLLGAPLSQVTNILKPTDFSRQDYGLIFGAMGALDASGQRIDVVTVLEHLRRFDQLTATSSLTALANSTPFVDNFREYAKIVRERSLRRHLHELVADSGRLTPDAVSRAERAVSQLKALATGQGAITPMNLLWYATLDGVVHQDQLVKGLIIAGSLFVIYGESNSGKTFWILDLALAVAAGRPWRGRRTMRGLVIYIAGEGASSVSARVAAYKREHAEIGAIPFCIVPQPVDFLNAASVDTLIATVRSAETERGDKAVLVVIDTFARAIPGGNENDAQDVGIAVAAADRLRQETGAAVGFIHHAGKDPTKGARGSSALRAATDTEVLIEGRGGTHTVTVTKQRDLMSGERFGFALRTVDLGTDSDGEAVTSCVVEQSDVLAAARRKIGGKNQTALLAALQERHRENPGKMGLLSSIELREIAKAQGIKNRARLKEAVDGLVGYEWLVPATGGYRFIPEESTP
jgi:hypothetical protein